MGRAIADSYRRMSQVLAAPVSNIRLGPEVPRASILTAAFTTFDKGCSRTNSEAPSNPAFFAVGHQENDGVARRRQRFQNARDLEQAGDGGSVIRGSGTRRHRVIVCRQQHRVLLSGAARQWDHDIDRIAARAVVIAHESGLQLRSVAQRRQALDDGVAQLCGRGAAQGMRHAVADQILQNRGGAMRGKYRRRRIRAQRRTGAVGGQASRPATGRCPRRRAASPRLRAASMGLSLRASAFQPGSA